MINIPEATDAVDAPPSYYDEGPPPDYNEVVRPQDTGTLAALPVQHVEDPPITRPPRVTPTHVFEFNPLDGARRVCGYQGCGGMALIGLAGTVASVSTAAASLSDADFEADPTALYIGGVLTGIVMGFTGYFTAEAYRLFQRR